MLGCDQVRANGKFKLGEPQLGELKLGETLVMESPSYGKPKLKHE